MSFWQKTRQQRKSSNSNLKPISSSNPNNANLALSPVLEQNLVFIKDSLGNPGDLIIRKINLGSPEGTPAALVYLDSMVNEDFVGKFILEPLLPVLSKAVTDTEDSHYRFVKQTLNNYFRLGSIEEETVREQIVSRLVKGNAVFLLDDIAKALILEIKGWVTRNIEEPSTEILVRGPREGFTENLATNIMLLRRRLATPHLRLKSFTLGSETQTNIVMAYLENTAPPQLIKEVTRKLDNIQEEAILESSFIQERLEDNPWSPFPTIDYTERPDNIAASLVEGRVAILTDGSPIALRLPVVFTDFFQSPEDFYDRYLIATFARWLRLFALLATLLVPSLYVAITTFHPQMLPFTLLLTFAAAREAVPFPTGVEALIMEFSFEFLREAGIRMPRPLGQAVSIVGALIVGEAAIQAGLVSPATVIVVAFTAIASFLLPHSEIAAVVRFLRFPFLALAGVLGLYGVALGLFSLHLHILSLRSFGFPYFTPMAPRSANLWSSVAVRLPMSKPIFKDSIFRRRDLP